MSWRTPADAREFHAGRAEAAGRIADANAKNDLKKLAEIMRSRSDGWGNRFLAGFKVQCQIEINRIRGF